MPVTVVGDIIRLALQALGVLAAGDHPSQEEYTDGVDWLNVMLGSWGADESMVPNLVTSSFDTVAATESYTIGSSGDIAVTRPHRIVNAYLSASGVDHPLAIQGKAEYNRIQNKAVTGMPEILFYVPSYPLGVIRFDRIPDAIYGVTMDAENPIVGSYTNENSPLTTLSPEYSAALVPNLTVTLAPVFSVDVAPSVAAMAKRTREKLQYQRHIAQEKLAVPGCDLIV